MSRKVSEQTHLISDMVKLVKDQKAKIATLNQKHRESLEFFQEQTKRFEQRIEAAEIGANDLLNSRQTNQSLKSRLDTLEKELSLQLDQRKQTVEEFQNLKEAHTKEKAQLIVKLEKLETHCQSIQEIRQAHDEAIRVKNKMLEDQNDTISNLKQALESKVKGYQAAQEEVVQLRELVEEYEAMDKSPKQDIESKVYTFNIVGRTGGQCYPLSNACQGLQATTR